jgi:hypothetical protein
LGNLKTMHLAKEMRITSDKYRKGFDQIKWDNPCGASGGALPDDPEREAVERTRVRHFGAANR